ncbi:MAG: GTPase Era [Burkholderiaceae bacterium]|jgi:GTP-binding protein Era|nr:GTPase Era [Burkholderiales bacterium]MCZ8099615.1 GTPase Era [Burkholderiales bacterium]MCZ8340900.1 GTPase Era [Burkholderiaceae bacterium]
MAESSGPAAHRCGHVAIVGRPNVGKSTLVNRLVGAKLSITSAKAQTTRHRIVGVVTRPGAQFLLLDTPGYQTRNRGALNRVLNRTAAQAALEADVVVLVADAHGWTASDDHALGLVPPGRPVVIALNKIDAVADKAKLMPLAQRLMARPGVEAIVPISAKNGRQVDALLDECAKFLPEGEALFDEDTFTDRSERFLAAEAVREKMFRLLGDELPYQSTVTIEKFEELPGLRRIFAAIVVERDAQKPIVLGAGGERIKRIASEARQDLERLLDCKVYLEVWVKVKGGWADDENRLRAYGYE